MVLLWVREAEVEFDLVNELDMLLLTDVVAFEAVLIELSKVVRVV